MEKSEKQFLASPPTDIVDGGESISNRAGDFAPGISGIAASALFGKQSGQMLVRGGEHDKRTRTNEIKY